MEEMHYFKESQREEIPVPDFKDNITRKLLLQFLCDLCTWAQAMPVTSVGIKKDAHSLYILFRNFAFSEQDFWQTFGGYLIALRPKWKIGIFGTELSSQETVALLLDQQNGKFYAVQKTISGRYADSIRSLCLRIECANTEDAAMVNLLCQHMDWQSGICARHLNGSTSHGYIRVPATVMGICQKIRNSRTTWMCYPSRRRSDSGCNSWKMELIMRNLHGSMTGFPHRS